MKQSTTQDRVYLTECLHFHEKRLAHFMAYDEGSSVGLISVDAKVRYHASQVKWFKAKLQGYFRESPIPAPVRSTMPSNPSLEFKATRLPAPPAEETLQPYSREISIPFPKEEIDALPPLKREPWYIRAYNKLRGL